MGITNSDEFVMELLCKYQGPILEACEKRGINIDYLCFHIYRGFSLSIEYSIQKSIEVDPDFNKGYMYGEFRLGALPELAVNIINNVDKKKLDMANIYEYLCEMNEICEKMNYMQRVGYLDGFFVVSNNQVDVEILGDDPKKVLEMIGMNKEGLFYTLEELMNSLEGYVYAPILN